MKVLDLNVDVKLSKNRLAIKYSGGFGSAISEMLSDEQRECLESHIEDIIEVVTEAIEKDFIKHIQKGIKEEIEEGTISKEKMKEFLDELDRLFEDRKN